MDINFIDVVLNIINIHRILTSITGTGIRDKNKSIKKPVGIMTNNWGQFSQMQVMYISMCHSHCR
jgi:hypothetical protein